MHAERAAVVDARVDDALHEGERISLCSEHVDLSGDGGGHRKLTAESGEERDRAYQKGFRQ